MTTVYKSLLIAGLIFCGNFVFWTTECRSAIVHSFSFSALDAPSSTLTGQIIVDVESVSTDPAVVNFTFHNNIGTASSITEIYFQDGPLIDAGLVIKNVGTTFQTAKVSPGDLPGGATLNPKFIVKEGFRADVDIGKATDGLDRATDLVTFQFTLQNNHTFEDVLIALANGYTSPSAVWNLNGSDKAGGLLGLRIGLHVRSIASLNGGSASFVNGAEILPGSQFALPEPHSLVAWSLGLAGVGCGYFVRRRRRVAEAAIDCKS